MLGVSRDSYHVTESCEAEDVRCAVAYHTVEGAPEVLKAEGNEALVSPFGESGLSFTVFTRRMPLKREDIN